MNISESLCAECTVYFMTTHAAVSKLMNELSDNQTLERNRLEAFIAYQELALAGLKSSLNLFKKDN